MKFLPFISTGFNFILVSYMKVHKKKNAHFLWNGRKRWHLFFCEFIALYNKVSQIGITLTISKWISYLLAHNFCRNITEFAVSFTSASKNSRNIKTTEELLVFWWCYPFIWLKYCETDLELCFFVFSSGQAYSNYEVFSLRGSIIDMHYLQSLVFLLKNNID